MNEDNMQVLRAFDFLKACQEAKLAPPEAQRALRALPDAQPLTLLWEQEGFDGSHHYDVLIALPDGGAASVSMSPAHTLPWPMRGVHRHGESDLLRVNGTVLRFDQAVAWLDVAWKETRIAQRLLQVCLLRDYLKANPIALSDAELQTAMDDLRRTHGLLTAQATHDWMAREGMTHDRLEWLVTEMAQINKLRHQVSADQIEPYFKAHRTLFDSFTWAHLQCHTQEEALTALAMCESERGGLAQCAQQLLKERVNHADALPSFQLRRSLRRELPDALGAVIDAASAGSFLGPVQYAGGWHLVEVLRFDPAQLNQETHQLIQTILFGDWLAELQSKAKIDWYWGEVKYTEKEKLRH